VIDPTAKIHLTAIVEKGAKIGARTVVMEFAIIRAGVEIGEDCEVMERVILGALPVSYSGLKRKTPQFGIKIGDRVHFHTSATVVKGTKRNTRIGDDCVFGQQTTIGHDSSIGNKNMINNHSTIGGWTETGEVVTIHLNVTVRERIKIGSNVEIGMGSNVIKDIKSNSVNYGNPCKFIRRRENPIKHLARRLRDVIS
jgi:UDP-N-acetylglucosamine acyltransferase